MRNKIFILIAIFLSACAQDDFTDIRDNISGNWRCQENSNLFGEQYYDVNISKSDSIETEILIYNFFDRKQDVRVTVEGNSLTIPIQIVDNWEISGTGEISTDYKTISWNFSADDGSGKEDFTAYFTDKSPIAGLFALREN